MVATGAIVAVNGLNPLSLIALVISGVLAIAPKLSSKNPTTQESTPIEEIPALGEFRIYRQAELNRTTASLLANGAILIAGEDGSQYCSVKKK